MTITPSSIETVQKNELRGEITVPLREWVHIHNAFAAAMIRLKSADREAWREALEIRDGQRTL